MKRTYEEIKEEMQSRGIPFINSREIIEWAKLFAIEDLLKIRK